MPSRVKKKGVFSQGAFCSSGWSTHQKTFSLPRKRGQSRMNETGRKKTTDSESRFTGLPQVALVKTRTGERRKVPNARPVQ